MEKTSLKAEIHKMSKPIAKTRGLQFYFTLNPGWEWSGSERRNERAEIEKQECLKSLF